MVAQTPDKFFFRGAVAHVARLFCFLPLFLSLPYFPNHNAPFRHGRSQPGYQLGRDQPAKQLGIAHFNVRVREESTAT